MKKIILTMLIAFYAHAQSPLINIFRGDEGVTIDVTSPSTSTGLLATSGADKITLSGWTEDPDVVMTYIYRDSLGAGLVTGDISTFTSTVGSWVAWFGGCVITQSVEKGVITKTATGDGGVKLAGILTINKTYSVSYKAKLVSGVATIFKLSDDGGSVGTNISATLDGTERTFTDEFTAAYSGILTFVSYLDDGTVIEVDDISVKEIITSTSHPDILIDSLNAGVLTYEDTNVTVGTTYNYRLKVRDASYNYSDYSAKASGIPEE